MDTFRSHSGRRLRWQLQGHSQHKPRYVLEDACVGCMECIEACVYKQAKVPDEFNMYLGKRKPIYIPFPQAVPQVVVIDPETCIEFKSSIAPAASGPAEPRAARAVLSGASSPARRWNSSMR